jgi:transposase-like protein
MFTCPTCQSSTRQVKHGRNPSGSQRYLCQACKRTYTPQPTVAGYDTSVRQQALRLYADGLNLRRIARHLGVVHQTVANWVSAHADALPAQPPQPADPVETAELDELYTFVGHKKTGPTS